ncbi:MAG: hypothetical protein WBJ21_11800 [Burkholderiaceae bacterium]
MFRVLANASARTSSIAPSRHIHLASNPLEQIRQQLKELKVGPPLQYQLVELHEQYHEELDQWSSEQAKLAACQPRSIYNEHARLAAEAYCLNTAIHEVSGFLLKYDVRTAGASLIDSISDYHRLILEADFQQAYRQLDEHGKMQLMMAVEPGVLKKMGIENPPVLDKALNKFSEKIPSSLLLTEAEFIATIDYLNSSTKLFAALNSAARIKDFYAQALFAETVACVSTELNAGLIKLSLHPCFARTDITVHKGVCMSNQAGIFRLAALDHALMHDTKIYSPHTVSATEEETQSYLTTKSPNIYNVGLKINIKRGAALDHLHDAITHGEHEVALPAGASFRVTGKSEQLVFNKLAGCAVPTSIYSLEQL